MRNRANLAWDEEPESAKQHAQVVLEYSETHNLRDKEFSASSCFVSRGARADTRKKWMSDRAVEIETFYGQPSNQLEKVDPRASVCVINFGEYLMACKGFPEGKYETDEEKMCHESNLFTILSSPDVIDAYYKVNNNDKVVRPYGPRMLYIPSVIFYCEDRDIRADVLTCTLPGRNTFNNITANVKTVERVSLITRLNAVLCLANQQEADTLIFSAFGSAENGIDCWDGYQVLDYLLKNKYQYCFKRVILAVEGMNYFNLIRQIEKNAENSSSS